MKKRFIFDENYIKRYAKKDKLKWLVIGVSALVLIIIIIIVILATRNDEPTPVEPVIPEYELKEELILEAGAPIPEVTDYFNKLENIDLNEIEVVYPDDFEVSYDVSLCDNETIEEINSLEEVNYDDYDCVETFLNKPTTYGIVIRLQNEEYTVNLTVEDTEAPTLVTNDVEIYEGTEYNIEDFITICYDVNGECNIAYYEETDEDGNIIDYGAYTAPGEYSIKLIASDIYENTTEPIEVTLTILEVEGSLYTVTFDSAGGSEVKAIKSLEGGIISKPTDPTRDGYTFVGWYNGNNLYNFNTPITSDLTLTARWNVIEENEEPNGGNEGGNEGGTGNQGGGNGNEGGSGIINVSSISLNYKRITLDINESRTVTAYIYPANATNKTVSWQSSDTSIATVSNGVITGHKAGTVTITATAGGKSTTMEVIVREASTTSCQYGDGNYNTSYTLSIDLRRDGCAVNPNVDYTENLTSSDYSSLMNQLSNLGFDGNTLIYNPSAIKIRNTAGTGVVGLQVSVTIRVKMVGEPALVTAEYIINANGTRKFLMNNVCANGVCIS